jgi:energy-converting hydrogenase Eha subunit E
VLAACGSGDGSGAPPSLDATLPPNASIGGAVPPAVSDPVARAADVDPPDTQPAEVPAEDAPADVLPDAATPSTIVTSDTTSEGTTWWPWVVGALLVIGIIAAIASRSRRGPTWEQ